MFAQGEPPLGRPVYWCLDPGKKLPHPDQLRSQIFAGHLTLPPSLLRHDSCNALPAPLSVSAPVSTFRYLSHPKPLICRDLLAAGLAGHARAWLAQQPAYTHAPPHLRHHMLDAGVDLRDVQIAAHYADPRTTMRCDRARQNLDRHPTTSSPPHGLRHLTSPAFPAVSLVGQSSQSMSIISPAVRKYSASSFFQFDSPEVSKKTAPAKSDGRSKSGQACSGGFCTTKTFSHPRRP